MKWALKILFWILGQQAKLKLIHEAKRQGVLAYLRVVQGSRRVLLAAFLAFFLLQIMVLSAVGALVTGIMLWDHDFEQKMEVLFWTFTGLFGIPFFLILLGLSQFVWYRVTGAKQMVDDLRKSA